MLLALHIETALDSSESEVASAMARTSISQDMLLLGHLKDISNFQQTFTIFEKVIARYGLDDLACSNVAASHHPQAERSLSKDDAAPRMGLDEFTFDGFMDFSDGLSDLPAWDFLDN